MKFSIVEILTEDDEAHCAVIPENWLAVDQAGCFWPKSKNVSALVARAQEPDDKFEYYKCRVLKWFDTYNEARKKIPQATLRSDLDSDQIDSKIKRVRQRKRQFSSSDESDYETSPQKLRKHHLPSVRHVSLPLPPSNTQMSSGSPSPSKKSPSKSSVKSPAGALNRSPVKSPATVSVKSLATVFVKSPAGALNRSPVKSPATVSVKSPAAVSVKSTDEASAEFSAEAMAKSSGTQNINDTDTEECGEIPIKEGDVGVSGLQLVKLLLAKVEKISEVQRKHGDQLSEICHRLRFKKKLPPRPSEVPCLPVSSLLEFDVLDSSLKKEENMEYLVKRLEKIGGNCAKTTVCQMLAEVMTRKVGAFFNWAGKGKKTAFKNTQVCKAVLDAAKNALNRRGQMTANVNDPVKEWLKYCTFREK